MNSIRTPLLSRWFLIALGLLAFLPLHLSAQQAPIELIWNPSTSANVVRYTLYYGTRTRSYSDSLSAGSETRATVTGLASGRTYFFAVTATDALGLESPYSSELSITLPSLDGEAIPGNPADLALYSPETGAIFTEPAAITLAASVDSGGIPITKVQFFQGDTLLGEADSEPYSMIWRDVGAGTYLLSAVAILEEDRTLTTAGKEILVVAERADSAPSITLTSPTIGTTFIAPASVLLAAAVDGNGNTISRVRFLRGSTLLAEDYTSPFTYTWTAPSGTHEISAQVVYGSGSTVSTPVRTVTVASPAPTISLSSPAAGASYTAPATIPLSATVTANGASISRVRFFRGSTLIAEDTTAPYSDSWSAVPDGTYQISAQVVYGAGDTVSTPVRTITVGSPIPTIALTSPAPGTSLIAPATIQLVAAVDPRGASISRVRFYHGSTLLTEDFTSPYSYTMSQVGPGTHEVSAQVVYGSGNTVSTPRRTVAVTAATPTITLTSPAPGTTLTAPATFQMVAAVDPRGATISRVRFYRGSTLLTEDFTSPYAYTLSGVGTGTHEIWAQAVYGSGSTVSTPRRTITIESLPPVVTLTSPASGTSYVAPATIPLTATVVANGNTISRVRFFNGSTLLTEDYTSPFAFTWNGVGAGTLNLSAQVVYGASRTANSAVSTVQVNALPSPWRSQNIGSLATTAVSTSHSSGIFTVVGAGNISGSADNFRYLFQSLSGDGQIQARLTSLANTGTSARVGLMIRESLTPGSRHVFLGFSPDGFLRRMSRSTTSGGTTSSPVTSAQGTRATPDVWLRLVRSQNTFTAYSSSNGSTWTLEGSTTLTMTSSAYLGIAVSSGSASMANRTTFSSVAVVP